MTVKREIEALLFATDSPLGVSRLRKLFPDAAPADFKAAVQELQNEYEVADHAFTIVEFGGGWQIATRPEYAPLVERLLRSRKYTRLSRAGLEVLAIIAYRQPITRLEIDEIRGVQSSGALATLQERNLITIVGRSEAIGHPLLYGTTREFLGHLGLRGLSQLPNLPTLESVVENREDLRAFANQFGEELSDDDFELLQDRQESEADNGAGDEACADSDACTEAGDDMADEHPQEEMAPDGLPNATTGEARPGDATAERT